MRTEDRQKEGRQIALQYCTNNVKTLGLGGLKNRNKNKNRMDRG